MKIGYQSGTKMKTFIFQIVKKTVAERGDQIFSRVKTNELPFFSLLRTLMVWL